MPPLPALSINELTTYRWTLDEDVYHAQKSGFDAIGLWRRKLSDFGEDRAVELLADAGLTVSCLGWAGGFTGGDGRSLDESIRDGLAAIGSAARVGAECLIVVAGGQNNHIRPHRNRLFRQALDELLMAAEVADVPLALKPMHPSCAGEWTFQSDLEQALELVALYPSPHLKLVYDHYHFPGLIHNAALLADLVPHLALVQLGDARLPHSIEQQRCPLGEGLLPVWATVAALCEAGYTGSFDVELMGPEIEAFDYERLLVETRHAFDTGVDAGRSAAVLAERIN
jgi:sugar phosphate isomerase/epimerase